MPSDAERLKQRVGAVMTRRVVLILEDIPMTEVRAIVTRYGYNGFPVVTAEGRLVGMITKGDLLRVLLAARAEPGVWADPVSRRMAHGVLALRQHDSIETAAALMVDAGLRSLPVIDDDARVVGILSRGDVMETREGRGEG